MFTKSNIKIMCIVAWLQRDLLYAELVSASGGGETIVDDTNYAKNNGALILKHWHDKGWTYKNILSLHKRIKKIKVYYDSIDKTIKKTVKQKGLDFNNNWIPMYLALIIAKKFRNENIEIFPESVDLIKMINIYSNATKVDKKIRFAYWSLASNILEDMRYAK